MTASRSHPNAHILAQLAEIAKTDPEPWKRLEVQIGNNWVQCGSGTPLLNTYAVFRIKPITVNIGGVELEGPLREAPEDGTELWLLFDHTPAPDKPLLFSARLPGQIRRLNEGRLFASKEARDRYQAALGKLAMGETK